MNGRQALPHYSLPPVVGERAAPGVPRLRELALTFTVCITGENSLCLWSGQHPRGDPVTQASLPRRHDNNRADHMPTCLPCGDISEGKMISHLFPLLSVAGKGSDLGSGE